MIFDTTNLKILNDKIRLKGIIPPNEKNQDLEIDDEKKLKYFETINKFTNKNKIEELLYKMRPENFNFTKSYDSLTKDKYFSNMSKAILQKIILESYESFFLELIEYDEEINSKDDLNKDEPLEDLISELKLSNFNKDDLFKNIAIINIFLKLFDQFEEDLKKRSASNSAPSAVEVITDHDPNFDPISDEEDPFRREWFENIKNYDSSRISSVPPS